MSRRGWLIDQDGSEITEARRILPDNDDFQRIEHHLRLVSAASHEERTRWQRAQRARVTIKENQHHDEGMWDKEEFNRAVQAFIDSKY